MFLVMGVLAALLERQNSGRGQVVDAAKVEGTGVLSQMMWALRAMGAWSDRRGVNLLDGGCPFYDTYTCADGRFVAVGALEPHFYAALLQGLELDPAELPPQADHSGWPELRRRFTEVFGRRTRDEWAEQFDGTDACVTPVLTFAEAPAHPHLAARGAHIVLQDATQPAPAPRFSRTPAGVPTPPPLPGSDTEQILLDWGITAAGKLSD
jgi:alpha-methylacyl-CoA racemase